MGIANLKQGFGGGIGRRIEEARWLGTQYYVENLIVKPSCKVTVLQILARIYVR